VDSARWTRSPNDTAGRDSRPVLVVIAAYTRRTASAVCWTPAGHLLDLPVDVAGRGRRCRRRDGSGSPWRTARTRASPVNRGQGAALRLGYQLATQHGGARYVITSADGQYDNSEMPLLRAHWVADTHDFVTGSRLPGVAPSDRPGALARRPLYAPWQPA